MNKRELRAFEVVTTNKNYIIFAYSIEHAKKRFNSFKGINIHSIKEVDYEEVYSLDY